MDDTHTQKSYLAELAQDFGRFITHFGSLFVDSAKNLKDLRCLTVTALLTACAVAAGFFKFPINESLQLRFDFIFLSAIGCLFGPISCMMAGVISDILGWVINPVGGPLIIGLTFNKMILGFLYGIFLYRKNYRPGIFVIWVTLSKFLHNAVINVWLNTYWLIQAGILSEASMKMGAIQVRITKNAVLLPIEIAIMFPILLIVVLVARRMKLIK